MVDDGSLQVLAILSKAAATIAEGEVLQLITQNDLSTTETRYLDVIKGKTRPCSPLPARFGAVVADRPEREGVALAEYGMKLGSRSSWSMTPWTTPPTRPPWARPSGMISAKARSLTGPRRLPRRNDRERAFWKRTIEALDQHERTWSRRCG